MSIPEVDTLFKKSYLLFFEDFDKSHAEMKNWRTLTATTTFRSCFHFYNFILPHHPHVDGNFCFLHKQWLLERKHILSYVLILRALRENLLLTFWFISNLLPFMPFIVARTANKKIELNGKISIPPEFHPATNRWLRSLWTLGARLLRIFIRRLSHARWFRIKENTQVNLGLILHVL